LYAGITDQLWGMAFTVIAIAPAQPYRNIILCFPTTITFISRDTAIVQLTGNSIQISQWIYISDEQK
jgi:hypothetical protein